MPHPPLLFKEGYVLAQQFIHIKRPYSRDRQAVGALSMADNPITLKLGRLRYDEA
jgi:hypothetical protein